MIARMFSKSHRSLISFIALIAILFSGLAPTLSFAFGNNDHIKITELICTSNHQYKTIEIDIGSKDTKPDAHNKTSCLDHCLYCSNTFTSDLAPNKNLDFNFLIFSYLAFFKYDYINPVSIVLDLSSHSPQAPPLV
jgi:hypothetical protein